MATFDFSQMVDTREWLVQAMAQRCQVLNADDLSVMTEVADLLVRRAAVDARRRGGVAPRLEVSVLLDLCNSGDAVADAFYASVLQYMADHSYDAPEWELADARISESYIDVLERLISVVQKED